MINSDINMSNLDTTFIDIIKKISVDTKITIRLPLDKDMETIIATNPDYK